MNKLNVMAGIVVLVGFGLFSDEALAGRPRNRQTQQQQRIHQGVRSGELTAPEYRRLEREQAAIRRDAKRAWRDDHLTPAEKARLEREQDRASRRIFRLKHNQADR